MYTRLTPKWASTLLGFLRACGRLASELDLSALCLDPGMSGGMCCDVNREQLVESALNQTLGVSAFGSLPLGQGHIAFILLTDKG